MSKLEKFKSIAQAAFEPVTVTGSATAPVRAAEPPGLQGTERLKSARMIPIDRITADPNQPRKHFSEKSLGELAASIASYGVLQPLTVSYDSVNDIFTIVTGERRYRAARRAGLKQLPCLIISNLSDQRRIYQQLIENLQREDISPFEEAEAFQTLVDGFRLKHNEIAQIVGKSRTYVTKTIGLTRIPESVRRLCAQRNIASREQFTILAQQKSEQAMVALLDELAHHGNDVRTVRKVARSLHSPLPKSRSYQFRYHHRGYTVRVSFKKSKVSKREVADALMEALESLDHK